MSMKNDIAIGVGAVAIVVAGTWLFMGNDLMLQKVFAPAQEQVRRDTFEQSKAYRDGSIQELRAMQFEYLKATPEQKVTLKPLFIHKAAGIPEDAMPSDLKQFINSL